MPFQVKKNCGSAYSIAYICKGIALLISIDFYIIITIISQIRTVIDTTVSSYGSYFYYVKESSTADAEIDNWENLWYTVVSAFKEENLCFIP